MWSIEPSEANGLTKKSLADCLQTRPIDYFSRLVDIRGEVDPEVLLKIDRGSQNCVCFVIFQPFKEGIMGDRPSECD